MFGFPQSPLAQNITISMYLCTVIHTISKLFHTGTKNSHISVQISAKSLCFTRLRPILYITVWSFFILFFHHPIYADNLFSPSFEIDMGTVNITGGSKSSATYRLSDTVGQTAQGQFNSSGYTVKAGFQYVRELTPFTFTISNLDLNYGSLVPGTPSLLTNLLTVTTGSAHGYTVKVLEDHALRISNGSTTIADTSCNLASVCTQTDATPWTDNSRYGFGYNIQGTDVDTADFVDNTYFRPFPIQDIDLPATVMSRTNIATASAATVTYKVNISGTQTAGTYQNNIQYIAIPSF